MLFFFSVRSNFISQMKATRENNIRSYTERKIKYPPYFISLSAIPNDAYADI